MRKGKIAESLVFSNFLSNTKEKNQFAKAPFGTYKRK